MKRIFTLAALSAAAVAASLPAQAHIFYTGRDFGSFTGLSDQTVSITNQGLEGNFGWADAADADYGDSHKSRAFRFHLDNDAFVTITAQAKADATSTSIGGALPGFSVYRGLAHVPPDGADYDKTAITQAWLATLPGVAKEGAWYSMGDWKVGNEAGKTFDDLSSFTFAGYAVDGTSANFGSTAGIVGDGNADGFVTTRLKLAAGDYSIFVGGADYAAQLAGNPNINSVYGLATTVSVSAVPEPETYALLLAGLAAVGAVARRRRG